ncbi:MAG: hypothetical protein RI922_2891 [Bacteroidota bacterium]|jgi:hypothetical protein
MNKEQGVRKILIFFFWLRYLSGVASAAFVFYLQLLALNSEASVSRLKNKNLQLFTSASAGGNYCKSTKFILIKIQFNL